MRLGSFRFFLTTRIAQVDVGFPTLLVLFDQDNKVGPRSPSIGHLVKQGGGLTGAGVGVTGMHGSPLSPSRVAWADE